MEIWQLDSNISIMECLLINMYKIQHSYEGLV